MSTLLDPVLNFAKSVVSMGYNSVATSIALQTGGGAKFPNPASAGDFNLVWYDSTNYPDPSNDPNVEIVRVTGISGDTLTVVRAQENTTATNKNTNGSVYQMILAPTALMIKTINSFLTLYSDNENLTSQYNGVSTTLDLAYSPNPAASLMLVFNNSPLIQGTDYTLSGNVITLASQWVNTEYIGVQIAAWYRYP